jgi:hypothetical protein
MINKTREKEKAILLRKQGKTYSEILSIIPVAKSTLSIWLQSVNLSKQQKQRITQKKLDSARRGGEVKRKQRIEKQNKILSESNEEISSISEKELFIIGVILYWAEGSKEKEYQPGSLFQFSNMDPRIIQIMLVWLFKVCKINKNMLIFNIFLHQSHKYRLEEIRGYWSKITGFPKESFNTVYWKKNKLKTNRKNTQEKYYGVLKIKVRESSSLVRKVAGWSEGIFERVTGKE